MGGHSQDHTTIPILEGNFLDVERLENVGFVFQLAYKPAIAVKRQFNFDNKYINKTFIFYED